MSTFHPAASLLANFNDTISMIRSHQDKKEPTFVMASQPPLFGDFMVNTNTEKLHQRVFKLCSLSRFWIQTHTQHSPYKNDDQAYEAEPLEAAKISPTIVGPAVWSELAHNTFHLAPEGRGVKRERGERVYQL